jgi:hypothetical protein
MPAFGMRKCFPPFLFVKWGDGRGAGSAGEFEGGEALDVGFEAEEGARERKLPKSGGLRKFKSEIS